VPAIVPEAVVFHRQSGTDTGFHGVELTLQVGRLQFALVRFWPGNALAIRGKSVLTPGQWHHVALTYDGSSTAAGMRIFLDGKSVDVEAVRDHLTKNLEPGVGHGGGGSGLTFGERFRSVGLKDGMVDELLVFDRVLSSIEVAHLNDGKSLVDALRSRNVETLRDYYLAAVDSELASARAELARAREALFAARTGVMEIMTMVDSPSPGQAYILHRGEYDAPKTQAVDRGTPASLPPMTPSVAKNRRQLARWLTQADHPLTARVAVNRDSQHFLRQGLLATTENFGVQGSPPTHPELLDWLARDFIESGWDVKRLCRQVVLSSTYRQQSRVANSLAEHDPDNELLARGPRRRLSAEMMRDMALYCGGQLVERRGGPPVKPYQPGELWHSQNAFLPKYEADKGHGLYRRSIYTFWRRTSPPPNMLAFDAPTREVCQVRRQSTMTPIQPLVLLNDPQFIEASRALGERMLRAPGGDSDRLRFGFRAATGRFPTQPELSLLEKLLASERDRFRAGPAAAQKLLAVGTRAAPADLNPVDLAAAATVASAILNLDATVMVR
jgi:hypothetical protein